MKSRNSCVVIVTVRLIRMTYNVEATITIYCSQIITLSSPAGFCITLKGSTRLCYWLMLETPALHLLLPLTGFRLYDCISIHI